MRYLLLVVVGIVYLAFVNSDACVQCNSQTDQRCATNPDQYMSKACSNSSSKCYTRVSGGYTIRGCASDLDNATANKCNNEMECLICTFMEGCNRQVFPLHRSQCLQCSGNSTNSTCGIDVYAKPTVCPIYKLGDKCYIRNTRHNGTENSFQRGCLSSAQAKKVCISEENCFTCEGVGCNFLIADDVQIPQARDNAAALLSSIAILFLCILTVSNL